MDTPASQAEVDEHEAATKRISELMQEYLTIKKVARDVSGSESDSSRHRSDSTSFLLFNLVGLKI